MTGVVVIDSNLLVLLVVGTASRDYVAKHKNTKENFDVDDFELLGLILAEFS